MSDVGSGGGQSPVSIPDMLAASTSYYVVSDSGGGGGTDEAGGMGSGDGTEIRLTNVSNGGFGAGPLQVERSSTDAYNSNHLWQIVFNPDNRRTGAPIKIEAGASSLAISIAAADTTDGNYFELREAGFQPDDVDSHRLNVERTEISGDHEGKFYLYNAKSNKYMCLADDWESQGQQQHVKQYADKAGHKAVWCLRKARR